MTAAGFEPAAVLVAIPVGEALSVGGRRRKRDQWASRGKLANDYVAGGCIFAHGGFDLSFPVVYLPLEFARKR
jgi:hypothetical protein